MNKHQIRCFLTAADENNFTRAAERLYITQPAISKVIGSLENELNVKLFLRHSNKRIELTEAGQLYREVFSKMRFELDAAQKAVRNLQKANHMGVRFAYASRWSSSFFLHDMLAGVYQEYPNLAVEIECMEFQQIVNDLMQGRLDLGLCFSDYYEDIEPLEYEQIVMIKRHIVYSDLYVQKHGPVRTPADFANATFFLTDSERERKTTEKVYKYFAHYGFIPQFQYLRNWDSVVAKVEAGHGVVIFDAWAQYLQMPNFRHIDLDSHHIVSLAWSNQVPPDIVRCFLDTLRRYAGKPSAPSPEANEPSSDET